jgi:hypothetical protein
VALAMVRVSLQEKITQKVIDKKTLVRSYEQSQREKPVIKRHSWVQARG